MSIQNSPRVACNIILMQRKFLGINLIYKRKNIMIIYSYDISSKCLQLLLNELIIEYFEGFLLEFSHKSKFIAVLKQVSH